MQWSLPHGAKMRIGKGEIYNKIAFSPDSSLLAAASSIGIWIYDGQTGKELKLLTANLDYDSDMAFSPDGKTIACSNSNELLLWDIGTGTLKLTISAHNRFISGIAFNPNGGTVATCSDYSKDDSINIWDVSTGTLINTIIAHDRGIKTITFSPDGKTLVSSGYEDENTTMKLWDVVTNELKTSFIIVEDRSFYVTKMAFSPDGNTIATCGGRWTAHIDIWDIASSSLKNTLIGHTGGVYAIAFSPDGKTLASGSFDNTICLWDVSAGEHKSSIIAHTDYITSVAYSPDGNTFASYGQDGTIILWDTEDFEQRTTITGHISGFPKIAFSPDGNTLVSGNRDKTLRLWDTTTGSNIGTFVGHIGPVISVDFSPDGQTIASSGGVVFGDRWFADDYPIRLWDVSSGLQTATIFGHEHGIYRVVYSPDGKYLLVYGSDKRPTFWDTTSGTIFWTFNEYTDKIGYISFSPDGKKFVYGDSNGVYLWDIASRKLINTYTGSVPYTSNIVFSPDGNTIAAGGVGQEVHLWNVYTGERKTIITGHDELFKTVLFSPDGQTILTAGGWEDGRLQFWDPETGAFKIVLHMPLGAYILAFSPDGKTLASSHEHGTILLWDYGSFFNTSKHVADVNNDGVVDIHDLVVVAANFGKTGENAADVNGDRVVNIADLIKVAAALEQDAAAPTVSLLKRRYNITRSDIQQWITQTQQLKHINITSQKGIRFLEQLLHAITPKETALLPNYPNPFNPETWIPYQLAQPSDVTIHIYSADGKLIRFFNLGFKPAGIYHNQQNALNWDGNNQLNEPVATGIYFYTLTAGKHTSTRKMLIKK